MKDLRLYGGMIILYVFNEIFVIIVNGIIRIYFGVIVVDIKFMFEMEFWNYILFVYKCSMGLV